MTQAAAKLVGYAKLKQAKDKQITLFPKIVDDTGEIALDESNNPMLAHLAADDIAEMQVRESVTGIVHETLTSLGDDPDIYIYPANGDVPEHIVIWFKGEKTRLWSLSVLRQDTQIQAVTAGEEVALPIQRLYGTLLVRDKYGVDRVCSGVDIPLEMEVSLTRGAEYELGENLAEVLDA